MPFVPILVLFSVDVPLGTGMAINIHCYSGDLILISICVVAHYTHKTGNVHTTQHAGTLRNYCCCGKAVSITYTECVSVALRIPHAQCIRCIIFLSVNLSGSTIFFHIYQKNGTLGGGGVIEYEMCVLGFSTTFTETFLILWRTEHNIIINVHRSSCKVPVILVRF